MRSAAHPLRLTLVVVLLLLPLALPLAVGQGPPGDAGDRRSAAAEARAEGQARAGEWQAVSQERRDAARDRAEDARLFSVFQIADGNATGRFASFGFDAEAGAIMNYTSGQPGTGAEYFTSVVIEDFQMAGAAVAAGNTWWMFGEDVTVTAHNNPTALLMVRAGNASATATFEMPEGAGVQEDAADLLTLNVGDGHGHLLVTGDGSLSVSGSTATADLGPNATVLFMHHPQQGILGTDLHAQRDAMREGRVGAALSVVAVEDTPVEDVVFFDVHARTSEVRDNGITVTVDANVTGGRSIVINTDNGTVPASSIGDVVVTVDGENASRGALANALSGGGAVTPVYNATMAGGALQVVVWVPGFSTHDITVESTDTGDEGNGGNGDTTGDDDDRGIPFPAWGAVVAVTALAAWGRRRRGNV